MRALLPLLLLACAPADEPDKDSSDTDTSAEPPLILDVAETEAWSLDGLVCDAHVVRTELDVPHIYASNLRDASVVLGFTYARDRYFTLDMARRLAQGSVGAVFGRLAVDVDVRARLEGMPLVATQLRSNLGPVQELAEGYAEGVTAYVEAVKRGELPLPSELELAGPLLGASDPTDLLTAWTSDDVASVLATLVFQLAFDDDDVGRGELMAKLAEGLYADEVVGHDLREVAVRDGLFGDIRPLYDVISAEGWTVAPAEGRRGARPAGPVPELGLLHRALEAGDRMEALRMGAVGAPRGSNAWAVTGATSADGRALLAGDGHLALTVPSLFWQLGIDTRLLGDEDGVVLSGNGLPGVPLLAVGTNGKVAWSQTRLRGDVVDWYTEEVVLGDDGLPASAVFEGQDVPLVSVTETVELAAALGGAAGELVFTRYATADGRRIVEIEGTPTETPEGAVRTGSGWIVPGDVDSDGRVTALSLDYAPFDPTGVAQGLFGFNMASSVEDFRDAMGFMTGYGQNLAVADAEGSVLYTSFQGLPCRGYLDRDASGWGPGADPTGLLDGTRYPGFTVPTDANGRVDTSPSSDPTRCAVPEDAQPWVIDPPSGFVKTANEDPGGHALDNDLSNDAWYLGGPWDVGFRGDRIAGQLASFRDDGGATLQDMQALQGDHRSPLGAALVPPLLDALDAGIDGTDAELAQRVDADSRLGEVRERLAAWRDRGFDAASGVSSTYHAVGRDEADDAVATMIFNAWLARTVEAVFGDEPIPSAVWQPSRTNGTSRAIVRLLARRGDATLPGYDAATGESVLFDVLGTPEIERSDVLLLEVLSETLDDLGAAPAGAGVGGFGTDDMDAWLWGLRHQVRFDSILGSFLGSNALLNGITAQFAITPTVLDPGPGLRDLPGFPRPGDNATVDAASQGFTPDQTSYGTGPVFRMAIALGPDGVEGVNILPGGQSALTDSPHFADQAALWLGNETVPLRWSPEQVVAGATGREAFSSSSGADCTR